MNSLDLLKQEKLQNQSMIQVDLLTGKGGGGPNILRILVVVVVVVFAVHMLLPIHLLFVVVVMPRTNHVGKMKTKLKTEMSSSYPATRLVVDSNY